MSLRNTDASPAAGPASWPARAAARRYSAGTKAAIGLAVVFAMVMLAAWAVPPALDWGRFRTGIAAIAAAQLGRPVAISGEVTLRLLPETVLTAAGVTLPDQGDGVSAELSTLRLQVAVLPLLAGRIRPRDLVLGSPVVHLPWPVPDSLAHRARGPVPQAFAAHIENGTLRIGQAEVTGINAGIHGGPEPPVAPGLLPDANGAGFGAEGFAAFAGQSWRFTGALGIPDADGVSALDLAVAGQGAAAQTNGMVRGTVADGVVQGRLRAGGPDLSLLMPAARLAWQADAPFIASGTSIDAASISVSLGGSPAEASLALHVARPMRLDGRVHAASLDLDSWLRVLGAGGTAHPGTGAGASSAIARLPGRIEVTADAARLLGGTVAGLHGTLVSDGESLLLDHAGGTLPGQAVLEMSGAVTRSAGLLRISGPGRLEAPELRSTLSWLRRLAPALLDSMPPATLRSASLTGIVTAGPGLLSVSGLAGQLDGTGVTGGFGVRLGKRPRFGASLTLDHVPLDDWIGAGWPAAGAYAGAVKSWSLFDGDVRVRAASGSARGVALRDLALDAHVGASGLRVDRAAAEMSGLRLTASGVAGVDGVLSDCAFRAATQEAAALQTMLPTAWRWTAGLWHGPASMEATLAGPPGAVAAQLRTDIGDLVVEAELRADVAGRTASGSVTLRHPGAPRLLAALGASGAERWLNTGSVSMRGQVAVRPGHASLQDFDLVAADLQLGGRLDVDYSGTEPSLHGVIDAGRLALPGWSRLSGFNVAWLSGWAAQLHVTAGDVTVGTVPAARSVVADLGLASGVWLLDVTRASVAGGGLLAGQLAGDAGQARPVVALRGRAAGLHLSGPVTGWPIDLAAGDIDIDLDASATGDAFGLDRVTGTAVLALHDAELTGLDLAAARQAAMLHGPAAGSALEQASHGTSAGLTGTAEIDLDHGRLRLTPSTLVSGDGAITAEGMADHDGLAMRLELAQSGARVTEVGPWNAIKATIDAGMPAQPLRPKHRRR